MERIMRLMRVAPKQLHNKVPINDRIWLFEGAQLGILSKAPHANRGRLTRFESYEPPTRRLLMNAVSAKPVVALKAPPKVKPAGMAKA